MYSVAADSREIGRKISKERIASSYLTTPGQLGCVQVRYSAEMIMQSYFSAVVSLQTFCAAEADGYCKTTMIPHKENVAPD